MLLRLKSKLKPGRKHSSHSRDSALICPGYSLSNKIFFIHQVTLMGSQGRETLQKIPWIKLTLLLENLTGKSVYRGIVNLLDLSKHSSNLPHGTTNVDVTF